MMVREWVAFHPAGCIAFQLARKLLMTICLRLHGGFAAPTHVYRLLISTMPFPFPSISPSKTQSCSSFLQVSCSLLHINHGVFKDLFRGTFTATLSRPMDET